MRSFLVIVALVLGLFLGSFHEFVALKRVQTEYVVAKERADTEAFRTYFILHENDSLALPHL